jgi:hypothetical protein
MICISRHNRLLISPSLNDISIFELNVASGAFVPSNKSSVAVGAGISLDLNIVVSA